MAKIVPCYNSFLNETFAVKVREKYVKKNICIKYIKIVDMNLRKTVKLSVVDLDGKSYSGEPNQLLSWRYCFLGGFFVICFMFS